MSDRSDSSDMSLDRSGQVRKLPGQPDPARRVAQLARCTHGQRAEQACALAGGLQGQRSSGQVRAQHSSCQQRVSRQGTSLKKTPRFGRQSSPVLPPLRRQVLQACAGMCCRHMPMQQRPPRRMTHLLAQLHCARHQGGCAKPAGGTTRDIAWGRARAGATQVSRRAP